MDYKAAKKAIINIALQQLEDSLNTAKNLMNEAQQMANEYGAPKDRYDSFRTKQARLAEIYSKQFDFAQNNIKILKLIDLEKINNKIDFGALVITDRQNILIGAGLGKIECNNITFFFISVQVPIYSSMKGKQEGDFFIFNDNRYTINKII